MSSRVFLLSLLLLFSLLEGKPPELSPRDARVKIEEILRAHATHHILTTELIERSFQNFIEELDPSKTYFIESEIVKWTKPSPELLSKALEEYKSEGFATFQEIYTTMVKAIERRNTIETKLKTATPPQGVQPSEFKDISWSKDEADLESRLLKIKSLHIETAEKYDPDTKATFFQRVDKRRLNHEQELVSDSPEHQFQMVLAFALKAISSALDSQTNYFTPSEANQFMMQVHQRLFGIGAQLRDDLNGFSIVRILDGGPAQDSKLKIGDKIIAVNKEPVVGMDITEAVEYIRGPLGTPVDLTVLRKTPDGTAEEKLEIEIIRGEVILKETRLESKYEPFGKGVIGIIRLHSFYQDSKYSSSSDLLQAINDLRKEHELKGIILDLRNNAGGLLPQAVSVAGLFMSKGVVVSVKDNTGQIQRLRNIDSKVAFDGPLIILTNRLSASAAEIVAQTLQEYGRAIIVGDAETYGKGTFQTFTLESANFGKVNTKGEYKVTRGRYYTVSGKSPQLVGVSADVVVPGLFSEMEIGEKYSKYPLETDQIASSFDDDLSDVPAIHRNQVMKLYKFNLQPILTTYTTLLPMLKTNAEWRLKSNKNYQNFMTELAKKEFSAEPTGIFGQTDLQLAETLNLMKDLLSLQQPQPSKAA
jgi:carboxyl-terminal processing protease